MQELLQQYGYLAILLGTFLEGETVLILAGFAAHRGYLGLTWVILAAFAGTFMGDQLFFYLGRRHSVYLINRRPGWKPRIKKVQRLIQKYQILIILGFRFLYGMRTITPFGLGMSQVSWQMFVPLNLLGALLWAVVFGSAGYLFGQAMETLLGDLKHYEYRLFALLIAGGILFWALSFFRRDSLKRSAPGSTRRRHKER